MGRGRKPGSPKTGGRQKGTKNRATVEVRATAQLHTAAAIKTLAEIMEKGKSETARIMAASALLDRGHGKPTQPIAGDKDMPPVSYHIDAPVKETREEWLARQMGAPARPAALGNSGDMVH